MNLTSQTVIPMLAYEDGVAAMDWLCDVFNFKEKTRMVDEKGRLSHGELMNENAVLMLSCPSEHFQSAKRHRQVCTAAEKWYQVPYIINGVLVLVDDVEEHFKRAKERGATILSEIETGGPGKRYRAEDLEGQRWMFMQK